MLNNKGPKKNNTIKKRREKKENGNHLYILSAAPIIHDQAVQLIFVHNDVLHPN